MVAAQEASGLSVREYCRRLGMPAWRLYECRSKSSQRSSAPAAEAGAEFEEIALPAASAKSEGPEAESGASCFRVAFRDGVVLRFDEAVDEGALRRVLRVLRDGGESGC